MRDRKEKSGFIFVIAAAALLSNAQSALAQAVETVTSKAATSPAKHSAPKPAPSKVSKANAKGKITEDGAVKLVLAIPEVKQFFKNVTKSKISKPAIDMDRKEGNAYVVHVYEIVNDGPDSSHTATKNWYYVDVKTGKITTEF